jgi:hypothetical protein
MRKLLRHNHFFCLTTGLLFCRLLTKEGYLLNLARAIGASQKSGAYRRVGMQRILVELGMQRLRVLVQCRSKRRWTIFDPDGGIRYLDGVLREMDGSWVVACRDLAALGSVNNCLPAVYQHLLTPNSDDWHPLGGKKAGWSMSRIEIEARFFLFTSLGALVHSEQFCPETMNQEQLVSDLLAHYPLERWYEMRLLTREQVRTWLEEALVLLTSGPGDAGDLLGWRDGAPGSHRSSFWLSVVHSLANRVLQYTGVHSV